MMNILLWAIQILLALLFLFAGASKFLMSVEDMNAMSKIPMPGWFIHFIGICELLGAIGLVVPWATGIKPKLTPIAAAGLTVIMIGATIVTIAGGDIFPAAFPLIVALLLALVAYKRWSATAV
jgi:uncharacterized membrane protein YphA (DoxX/SURF4 family)